MTELIVTPMVFVLISVGINSIFFAFGWLLRGWFDKRSELNYMLPPEDDNVRGRR